MFTRKDDFHYKKFRKLGTGGQTTEEINEIVYPFDKYEIKVSLSPDNKFIGITGIKINKDFLSYKQKISRKGFHDVEDFYPE